MPTAIMKERVERVTFSNRINKQLLKDLKKIAVDEEKDLYVVLEEALQKFVSEKTMRR